jgi:hypothetical protein
MAPQNRARRGSQERSLPRQLPDNLWRHSLLLRLPSLPGVPYTAYLPGVPTKSCAAWRSTTRPRDRHLSLT